MAPPIDINGSTGIIQNTAAATRVPVGLTSNRPGTPAVGQLRINTDRKSNVNVLEFYDGTNWIIAGESTLLGIQAFGGIITDVNIGGIDYRIHAFNNPGTSSFTVDSGSDAVTMDVLVVGGGGGGEADGDGGGAGGAGGLVYAENIPLTAGSYSVIVGDGGSRGSQGNDSYFDQNGSAELRGIGGGAGGRYQVSNDSLDGGSGGGSGATDGTLPMNGGQALQPGTNSLASGNIIFDEGNPGGSNEFVSNDAGASGGGATQPGKANLSDNDNDMDGGDGRDMSSKFGTNFGENGVFAGGGGGHHRNTNTDGPGGDGGGGRGRPGDGDDGQPNTGGGGGSGDPRDGGNGSNGGSGIVLIRYEI